MGWRTQMLLVYVAWETIYQDILCGINIWCMMNLKPSSYNFYEDSEYEVFNDSFGNMGW